MIDPERQKRVIEQTTERYAKDEQFKAQVEQTIAAAHAPDKRLIFTNVALMLAQAEQMAREEVLAEMKEFQRTRAEAPERMKDLAKIYCDGFDSAVAGVQAACDKFGEKRIVVAGTEPRRLES